MSPFPIYPGNNAVHGAIVPIGKAIADGNSQALIFTNIPQIYQDLMVVYNIRESVSSSGLPYDAVDIQFNLDSGTTYSATRLQGDGASATSSRTTNQQYGGWTGYASTGSASPYAYGNGVIHVLNYANNTTYKSAIGRSATDLNGSGVTSLISTLWRNTSAINIVSIFPVGANMSAGSTVTLYGVRSIGQ